MKRGEQRVPLSDADFARQMAEINASLARLKADIPRAQAVPKPRERALNQASPAAEPASLAGPGPVIAQGLAKAEVAVPTPQRTSATQGTAPAPVLPQGTDLADPRNFGLLPPVAELQPGTTPADEFRQRLTRHLEFATRVLHTSGVPAAVWREWRSFEKNLRQQLQIAAVG